MGETGALACSARRASQVGSATVLKESYVFDNHNCVDAIGMIFELC